MSLRQAERAIPAEFTGRSLSLAQASAALGVSRRTLYYWIKGGRLRTVRTSLGSQRVLVSSLREGPLEGGWPGADRPPDEFRTDACGSIPTEG